MPPPALLFLPGFLTPAGAYRDLLAPIEASGASVTVPTLYGLSAAFGRYSVTEEARDAAELAADLGPTVWLAGHSRGGQAAWLAASQIGARLAGLIVIDPVDGAGRRPSQRTTTAHQVTFDAPVLIIGAGLGGRCAPEPVNHRAFAAACPGADHLVIDQMGHADILSGNALTLGRFLCGGGPDPARVRAQVTAHMAQRMGLADLPGD